MLIFSRSPLDVPLSLPRPAVEEQAAAPMLSALAFFFVMTSYYIIRPVRDQLSGAVGSTSLPLFYGAVFGPLVTKLLVQVIGVAPLLVVSALALSVSLLLLLRLSARHGADRKST